MSAPVIANHAAERQVLGALLWDAAAASEVFTLLRPEDFRSPGHQFIAVAIRDLNEAGVEVAPATVLTALREAGVTERVPLGAGSYLLDLREQIWNPSLVLEPAREIALTARRNRFWEACTRGAQRAESPVTDLADAAVALLAEIEPLTEPLGTHTDPPPDVADFMTRRTEPNWLVEGLLGKGERLILTGGEGAGKSLLARQIAACVAAGLHPFTRVAREPRKVLVIDAENPGDLIARWLRRIYEALDRCGRPVPAGGVRIIHRPEGLDLARPFDEGWLTERVISAAPDLIVMGPLYRLHTTDQREEPAALALVAMLDRLRARTGSALIIEAHSPHAEPGRAQRNLRPIGSTVWMRWPEFGYGIRPLAPGDKGPDRATYRMVPWRGPRDDERAWPAWLRHGDLSMGELPWVDCDGDPEFGKSRLR